MRRRTAVIICAAAAVVIGAASFLLDRQLTTTTGLSRSVTEGPGFDGPELLSDAVTATVDLAFLDSNPDLPSRFFSARWTGFWYLDRAQAIELHAGADDRLVVSIDGQVVVVRDAAQGTSRTAPEPLALDAGARAIVIEYEQHRGGYSLNLQWALAGEDPGPLPARALFPSQPNGGDVAVNRWLSALRGTAVGLWVMLGGLLVWPLARRPARSLVTRATTRWTWGSSRHPEKRSRARADRTRARHSASRTC